MRREEVKEWKRDTYIKGFCKLKVTFGEVSVGALCTNASFC